MKHFQNFCALSKAKSTNSHQVRVETLLLKVKIVKTQLPYQAESKCFVIN